MKQFLKEFKAFALKGNVMDMAIGVIIGGAFSKIVTSLVTNVFTPLLSLIGGNMNFTKYNLMIGEIAVEYGIFLQDVFDFVMQALCIFIFIKIMAKLSKKQEEAPKEEPVKISSTDALLMEIRDELKKR